MYVALIPHFNIEYSIPLANALSKSEKVLFIVWKNLGLNYLHLIDALVEVEYLDKPPSKSVKNLRLIKNTINIIKKKDPDVVHIQNPFSWLCSGLSSLKNYPIVFTVHDPAPHLGRAQIHSDFTMKLSLGHANRVIVHGNKMKEVMVKKYNIPEDIVKVIPHGDFSFYIRESSEKFEEQENTILFFGRIWKYKGLEYLIRAEETISKKVTNFKIIIAGMGDFKKYRKLIKNKEKFVIYNEYIPNEMVSELFQKASIVVLPYIEASQSGVIPIAYSFKKPVVVTDVGSIPEVVEDGNTGFIVPPKNPKKLAEAIITLLANNEKRKMMGENAYKKMKTELSWEVIAKKTIEVYREVA
jgi:glycosyltransferase involved in cell wall biosynthesis